MKIADVVIGETYLVEIAWTTKAAVKVTEKGFPFSARRSSRSAQNVGVRGEVLAIYKDRTWGEARTEVGDTVEFAARSIEAVYGPWKEAHDERLAQAAAAEARVEAIRVRLDALRIPHDRTTFNGTRAPEDLRVTLPADAFEALLDIADRADHGAAIQRRYQEIAAAHKARGEAS